MALTRLERSNKAHARLYNLHTENLINNIGNEKSTQILRNYHATIKSLQSKKNRIFTKKERRKIFNSIVNRN
jgi:hypothetical protein